SDIDPAAIDAARANAKAAGVFDSIRFDRADVRSITPLTPPGTVIFNPPYGERMGAPAGPLVGLYREIGQRLRTLGGHEAIVLCGNKAFAKAVGMIPKAEIKLYNGPIECTAARYEIWDLGRSA